MSEQLELGLHVEEGGAKQPSWVDLAIRPGESGEKWLTRLGFEFRSPGCLARGPITVGLAAGFKDYFYCDFFLITDAEDFTTEGDASSFAGGYFRILRLVAEDSVMDSTLDEADPRIRRDMYAIGLNRAEILTEKISNTHRPEDRVKLFTALATLLPPPQLTGDSQASRSAPELH